MTLKRKASAEAVGQPTAKAPTITQHSAAGPSTRAAKPPSTTTSRPPSRPPSRNAATRPNVPTTAPRRITRSASGPAAIRPTNAKPPASGVVRGQRMIVDNKGKGPLGKSIVPPRQGAALKDTQNQLQVENELNAERSKAADLHSFQSGLQCELAAAKSTELETRRAYLLAADEIDSLKKQHAQVDDLKKLVAQRDEELRDAEMIRRKLHNQVLELKGNIRVFCRVRPSLPHEKDTADGLAQLSFPGKEKQEIVVTSTSESATGAAREAIIPFTFDRVFAPGSSQENVFEEISLLAQSCTDGYNVCIFAYGQTGSGKSFTMEGGSTDQTRGMIPRAVQQMFRVTEDLAPRGWEYRMEGQFLEIYNETINDLLGTGEIDKKKHEIKHEKGGKTTVTDIVVVPLTSPAQVHALLQRAHKRRTVAATLMNERSSRSHSVFTLRVTGQNTHTGESCTGSLNLVDLAGSERLSSSGAANDRDRLKETQAINKSLSALGDVIAALGSAGGGDKNHIPYRNSKLTYLLQNSLSGNSKTLMMMNMSPLAAHLGESLCSLRFATKVNSTTLGIARKQVQTRPS
ncbi:kinesin-like nuclear fusion protein [Ceratobasidium sp. 394]|nr:kinesin-like nuclear fusion protein [Ceratobasidium sp. 394]